MSNLSATDTQNQSTDEKKVVVLDGDKLNDPVYLATNVLEHVYGIDGTPKLRHYAKDFYRWRDGAWTPIPEADVTADILDFLYNRCDVDVGDVTRLFEGEPLSNVEQVSRIVEMARKIGRDVAGPSEARKLLAAAPEG